MRLHPIESEALEAVGYDAEARVLRVRFIDGGTYDYSEVPRELYERLLDAQPHPWRDLQSEIREHPYTRLD